MKTRFFLMLAVAALFVGSAFMSGCGMSRTDASRVAPIDHLQGIVKVVNFVSNDELTATFITFSFGKNTNEFPTRMLCGDQRTRFREGQYASIDIESAPCGWQVVKQY